MIKEREIELKSLVNEDTYTKLVSHFAKIADSKPIYKQTNYYFDTKDQILNKNKIVLRLRVKKGKLEITAKLPTETDGTYNDNLELNDYLTESVEHYCNTGLSRNIPFIENLLNTLNLDPNTHFEYLGDLITERCDFKYNDDTISVDKNYYNGLIDYEVEWETNDVETVINEFKQLGLTPGNSVSKFQRFLNSIK